MQGEAIAPRPEQRLGCPQGAHDESLGNIASSANLAQYDVSEELDGGRQLLAAYKCGLWPCCSQVAVLVDITLVHVLWRSSRMLDLSLHLNLILPLPFPSPLTPVKSYHMNMQVQERTVQVRQVQELARLQDLRQGLQSQLRRLLQQDPSATISVRPLGLSATAQARSLLRFCSLLHAPDFCFIGLHVGTQSLPSTGVLSAASE